MHGRDNGAKWQWIDGLVRRDWLGVRVAFAHIGACPLSRRTGIGRDRRVISTHPVNRAIKRPTMSGA
jgi:hypothetical protein